jgi:hypothetical protein
MNMIDRIRKKNTTDEHRKNMMNTDTRQLISIELSPGSITCFIGVYQLLSVFIGVLLLCFSNQWLQPARLGLLRRSALAGISVAKSRGRDPLPGAPDLCTL